MNGSAKTKKRSIKSKISQDDFSLFYQMGLFYWFNIGYITYFDTYVSKPVLFLYKKQPYLNTIQPYLNTIQASLNIDYAKIY